MFMSKTRKIFKQLLVKLILTLPDYIDHASLRKIKDYQKQVDSLINIGVGTYGTDHIVLHSWNLSTKLHIGKYCSIADEIHVYLGGNHNMNSVTTFPFSIDSTPDNLFGTKGSQPLSKGDIHIGNDVWIGSNVSIMSGIEIGSGSVIAAFSHVVKDVLPYEVVGGNPARHIKFRFSKDIINQLLEIAWWDWPQDKILRNVTPLLSKPSDELMKFLKT